LRQRHAANAERPNNTRKPMEQVLVSTTDPEAVLARDKLNVFRPLYSIQLLRDIDSPLILGYDVLLQNNDNGVLPRMVERMLETLGLKPLELLADSGYISMRDLEFCAMAGITLYGPIQENDFSEQNGKQKQTNQFTKLAKSYFKWLAAEQEYECPEGQRLTYTKTKTQGRTDYSVKLHFYSCDPKHCLACSRQQECTPAPHKGRSVSRLENEHLLEELRERMQKEEVKRFYKIRSQTVELNYADLKEHRGLRRFHGRGLTRTTAEVATLILAHNLLALEKHRATTAVSQLPQTACAA
jgi:hypothetical protein